MTPYWADDLVTVHHGDCLDVMREMLDGSVDSVVTDPPYGLAALPTKVVEETFRRWLAGERDYAPSGVGFMGRSWDAFVPPPAVWDECLRVLKPGGHLLAFAGSRTHDLMTLSIRLAGFEIRDSIATLYGSGFPKSLDVSKAIDKQRDDRADIVRVTSFLADHAEQRGISRADVDAHMQTSDMGGWWLSRIVHRCAVPKWEQWLELRELIGFGGEMDAEVWRLNGRKGTRGEAWDAREVIGERTTGIGTGRGAVAYIGDSDNRDITAPATDDAKRWEGFGTALKPSFEPVVVGRKPLDGTVAQNIQKWGCGGINVDACRIRSTGSGSASGSGEAGTRRCPIHSMRCLRGDDTQAEVGCSTPEVAQHVQSEVSRKVDERPMQSELAGRRVDGQAHGLSDRSGALSDREGSRPVAPASSAGLPRTQVGDGAEDRSSIAARRDGASHQRREGRQPARESTPDGLGESLTRASTHRTGAVDAEVAKQTALHCTCGTEANEVAGAGRWPPNVILDEYVAAELDRQSGILTSGRMRAGTQRVNRDGWAGPMPDATGAETYGDSGGPSRFFPVFRYEPKAGSDERPEANGVRHPTVKSLDLMKWLVRLVNPPGGTVLDPFAGSGTTAEACVLESFRCIAIEREADYLPLIKARLSKPLQQGLFGMEGA